MASLSPQWAGVRAFLSARTGMALSGSQLRRLDERLTAHCRGLSPQQYLLRLKSPTGAAELQELVSSLVVHKTDLFRDDVQLAAFKSDVLAPLAERARRPLRLWSAGCATGEEVATLLVMLADVGADPGSSVLGTDISSPALRRARELAFTPEQLRRVPPVLRERFFIPMGPRLGLVPAVRERSSFQLHNLMDTPYPTPPGGGLFDVIFCRNVLIYFTVEAFQRTVVELAARLAPGGTLVLSSAEPLLNVPPSLDVVRTAQAFFYVRNDRPASETTEVAPAPAKRRDVVRAPSPVVVAPPLVSARGGTPNGEGRDPSRSRGGDPGAALEGGDRASDFSRTQGRSGTPNGEGRAHARDRDAALNGADRASDAAWTRDRDAVDGEDAIRSRSGVPGAEAGQGSASPESTATREATSSDAEADLIFAIVLDGVSTGVSDARTELDLRRCLALDEDHAAARYLLGLLLEQCSRPVEAAAEYRRALQSLEAGRSRPIPFFLNASRLRLACAHAAEKLEASGRHR